MRRILSLAVAFASAVALTSPVEAKSDKHKGGGGKGNGKGGGGGARVTQNAHHGQKGGGGNFARVNPSHPAQVHRKAASSVALTGRTPAERAAAQQRVANQGLTWNERRNRIINRLQAQQRWENRKERWEDRQDYWKDRHEEWKDHHDHDYDWNDDHHYYLPFSVYQYWDHNRVYYWNNNPYHWYNNAWVTFSPGYDYGYNYDYAPGYGGGGSVTARVQERLAREGYNPGPIDGALGARTRDAIVDFQRDHQLAVTGRIDTPLLRELGL